MRRPATNWVCFALLMVICTGCASVGCELNPLQPKKALRCEMPLP